MLKKKKTQNMTTTTTTIAATSRNNHTKPFCLTIFSFCLLFFYSKLKKVDYSMRTECDDDTSGCPNTQNIFLFLYVHCIDRWAAAAIREKNLQKKNILQNNLDFSYFFVCGIHKCTEEKKFKVVWSALWMEVNGHQVY